MDEKETWPARRSEAEKRRMHSRLLDDFKRIAILEACALSDGTRKRGAEVPFRESVKGRIRCLECAKGER